jgi:uncharacterized protein
VAATRIPRYVPDRPFPAYTFVPRRTPHPTQDPAGHSHRRPAPAPDPLDPGRWQACTTWLQGVDLFNHGYYWEAHEAWESLWHVCGRAGTTADFLRALIRLAAAGVKAREPNPRGVARHLAAVDDLLRRITASLGDRDAYLGLALAPLRGSVAHARLAGSLIDVAPDTAAAPVFRFVLELRCGGRRGCGRDRPERGPL